MSGFMILGCPRSGTNLFSNLIREYSDAVIQIEPFSMHTSSILNFDLMGGGDKSVDDNLKFAFDKLNPFLKESELHGFKETSLFEHLGTISNSLAISKVLYIERETTKVAASYVKNKFYYSWELQKREAFRHWKKNNSISNVNKDMVYQYALYVTQQKKKLWAEHSSSFDFINVKYEDLIDDPFYVLNKCYEFLGVPHSLNKQALRERVHNGEKEKIYAYATL